MLMLCMVGAVAIASPSSVWDRLAGLKHATNTGTLAEVDPESSADGRYEIWKVGTAIAVEHPVFGIGAGGYPKVHAQYAQSNRFRELARGERDTHNLYINAAAESGFVGLALLMGMVLSVALAGWKAVKNRGTPAIDVVRIRVLVFGLIAFMQASIFATMEHLPFLYLYMAVIYSAVEASKSPLSNEDASETSSPSVIAPHPRQRRR